MQAWQATVQDDRGNAVPNPVITVYEADGVTEASIFNEAGVALPNPLTGSLDGFVQFFAEPGEYKVDKGDGEVWDIDLGALELTRSLVTASSYSDAVEIAPSLPSAVLTISAVVGGKEVRWIRDVDGVCLGGGWSPAGKATQGHFGGDLQALLNYGGGEVSEDTVVSLLTAPQGAKLDGEAKVLTKASGSNLLDFMAGRHTVTDVEIDMRYDALALGGFPIRLRGNDNFLERITFRNYGSLGGEDGGAAVHLTSTSGLGRPARNLFRDLRIYGSPAADINIGWLAVNTDMSFFESIYSEGHINGIGYAHELKNDARHNVMSNLISNASQGGLVYGQQGGVGPSRNMAHGIVSKRTRRGYFLGACSYNVLCGMMFDAADPIAGGGAIRAVDYANASDKNATFGVLSTGGDVAVQHSSGSYNFTQVASYDEAAFATFTAGVGNVVEVAHTGEKTSILGQYTNAGTMQGASANVIYSPSTGEFFGSRSAFMHWKLGESGATRASPRQFVFENVQHVQMDLLTPGNNGDTVGLIHSTPTVSRQAALTHTKGSSNSGDYWLVRTGGANVLRVYNSALRAELDNSVDLGTSSVRFRDIYAANGTIQTSDAREKSEPLPVDDAVLDAWSDVQLVAFQWLASVTQKGDLARVHHGVIAQQVEAAFAARGLDARRYGLFCVDTWGDQYEPVFRMQDKVELVFVDIGEDGEPLPDGELRTVEVIKQVPVQVGDRLVKAAGERLGIRADQCLFVEASYQRRRMDRLEARLNS